MLISYILFRYGVKSSGEYGETTHMKWNTLKKLYWINPEAWQYHTVIPCGMYRKSFNKVLMYQLDHGKKVRVHLSYFGYLAFRFAQLFGKHKYDKGMELILNDMQDYIDELRNESQAQILQANQQMEDIKLRLREEHS